MNDLVVSLNKVCNFCANWNEIWSPPQLIAKHRTIFENKQNLLFLETTNMIELKLNLNEQLMALTKYDIFYVDHKSKMVVNMRQKLIYDLVGKML